MTATATLRLHLDAAGVDYSTLGDYGTVIHGELCNLMANDSYDGTLSVHVTKPLKPDEVMTLVRGRVAEMETEIEPDGEWGRSWCGACGRNVGPHYRFCPWCGARLTRPTDAG